MWWSFGAGLKAGASARPSIGESCGGTVLYGCSYLILLLAREEEMKVIKLVTPSNGNGTRKGKTILPARKRKCYSRVVLPCAGSTPLTRARTAVSGVSDANVSDTRAWALLGCAR